MYFHPSIIIAINSLLFNPLHWIFYLEFISPLKKTNYYSQFGTLVIISFLFPVEIFTQLH